jgi:hypothetical protein
MSLAQGKSPRRPAAAVPSITGLRLSPLGAEASLVNISETGLLADCPVRLKVGSPTKVLFEGAFFPSSVSGRVARCEVNAMGQNGGLRYHIGIEFNAPIALDRPSATPSTVRAPGGEVHEPPLPPARIIQNRW